MTAGVTAAGYGVTEPENVAEVWSWWSWASCVACGQGLGSETQADLQDYLAEHQARYHGHVDPAPHYGGRPAVVQLELEL